QNPDLDEKALKTHLIEQGFEGELQRILTDSIYTHASFARARKEADEALGPWREAWKTLEDQSSAADLERAKAALMQDLTEDNENRLKALREIRKSSDG